MFNTLRNKSSSLILRPCKFVQESSEKVLFIKTRQISRQMYLSRFNIWSSTNSSIKNYEIQISKSNFTYIHVYLCRVSFLTNLYIYKDYFKGRQRWCNLMQSDYSLKLWPKPYALVHLSLKEAAVFVCRKVLQPASFSSWWLVTYLDLCID